MRHAEGEAEEFLTIRPEAAIPHDVKVVMKFGKPGTPVQIEEHPGHYRYSVIAPGASLPQGPNVKVIVLKLVEGTLVEIKTQDGKKQLDVIPPGQQIPLGAVVVRRPDGKAPPGTLIEIELAGGQTIQQIVPPGQAIPPNAKVISTSSHSHGQVETKREPPTATYPTPPNSAQVPSSDASRSMDDQKNANLPSYAQTPNKATDASLPAYLTGTNDPSGIALVRVSFVALFLSSEFLTQIGLSIG